MRTRIPLTCCLLASLVAPAWCEIVAVEGAASAVVTEHRGAVATDSGQTLDYPATSDTLPLCAVTRSVDPNEQAAAIVAAQFADPRTAAGPDPDEFAIDLALNTLSPDIHYSGTAYAEERRTVRFTPADMGVAAGQTAHIIGRMYLDGALAIFAGLDMTDLTGASVNLRVTISLESPSRGDQQVFSGALLVSGGPNHTVTIAAEGDIPRVGVFDTDLAAVDPQLGVFRAFVFPNLMIEYPFDAVCDETCTLHARVTVDGQNVPGQSGVAALIGLPMDALIDVVTATSGQSQAAKMSTALLQERDNPTGEEAFAQDAPTSLCPLFGSGALLATLAGLVASRRRATRRPMIL